MLVLPAALVLAESRAPRTEGSGARVEPAGTA
jgi:hypothetical protein